jgi:cytochrome b561
MSKETFVILLLLLFVAWGFKRTILRRFHKQEELLWLSQSMANYLFVLLFIILVVIGMLFTENAKTNSANVSEGFEKVRQAPESKEPHRYFNIDFSRIFPDGNE